jgi:hypothetical protein
LLQLQPSRALSAFICTYFLFPPYPRSTDRALYVTEIHSRRVSSLEGGGTVTTPHFPLPVVATTAPSQPSRVPLATPQLALPRSEPRVHSHNSSPSCPSPLSTLATTATTSLNHALGTLITSIRPGHRTALTARPTHPPSTPVASSARPPVRPQHHFGDFHQSQAWHTSVCPIAPLHIASALVPNPS